MSREHSHHHPHPARATAGARISALSSGVALRFAVACAAGVALWLTVLWAIA